MIEKPNVIGLIGGSGNLGSVVHKKLVNQNFDVELIGRQHSRNFSYRVLPGNTIQYDGNYGLSCIVNLSNYYSPKSTTDELEIMTDSILGVAKAVANMMTTYGTPVISASTYFQYCPSELAPWSAYADLKRRAQESFLNCSSLSGSYFSDFVLYDNYGGKRKSKFLDLAIRSTQQQEPLKATPGDSIINLCHIENIADQIVAEVNQALKSDATKGDVYELRSSFTYSLRSISDFIKNTVGVEPNIEWGALAYRDKEVFSLWDTGLRAPTNWYPEDLLARYILDEFSRLESIDA